MEINQIYEIVNELNGQFLGKTDVLNADLSNIVDVGKEIVNLDNLDKYTQNLIDRIGKVTFVDRPYSGSAPSVMMDGWEYGAILEKITYDELPVATSNDTWELQAGKSYDVNVFTKPNVSAKFFDKRTTFEVPMSFAERQVKSAFDSVSQLNAFFSMIRNAIDKTLTIKYDGLISDTINNAIAETILDGNAVRAVNLLKVYNTKFSKTLKAADAIYDKDFIRFASLQIRLCSDRLTKISKLFNIGGKDRFTAKDLQHIVLLSEFEASAETYLYSDTFHEGYNKLPKAETVAFWQGSGTSYDFTSTSKINVKTTSNATLEQTGILGIIFDRDALGVSNIDRRVTANYNGRGEFFNNWYKSDAGYFNDFNENFVVFYIDDDKATA